jgi:hypothetical protein
MPPDSWPRKNVFEDGWKAVISDGLRVENPLIRRDVKVWEGFFFYLEAVNMNPLSTIVTVSLSFEMRDIGFPARRAGSFMATMEPDLAIHSWGVRQRIIKIPEKSAHVIHDILASQPIDVIAEKKFRWSQLIIT